LPHLPRAKSFVRPEKHTLNAERIDAKLAMPPAAPPTPAPIICRRLKLSWAKSKVLGTFDGRLLTSKVPDTFDFPRLATDCRADSRSDQYTGFVERVQRPWLGVRLALRPNP